MTNADYAPREPLNDGRSNVCRDTLAGRCVVARKVLLHHPNLTVTVADTGRLADLLAQYTT